jgi:tetratricopeptide (TPR) repeat protein
VQFYEGYLKRYPNGEFAEKARYNLGNIYYLNLRDSAKAREEYEGFLEKYPMSQFAFAVGRRLAELYERDLQDYRKAIDVLEQISMHTPSREDWRQVRYEISDDYFRLDEFDQSIIEFKKLIGDQPAEHLSDEARLKLAAIYEIRRQWSEAITELQEVIQGTKCVECRRHSQFELVDCYASLEHYDQAIAALKKVDARPEDQDFIARRLAALEQSRRGPLREVNWQKTGRLPRRAAPAARPKSSSSESK